MAMSDYKTLHMYLKLFIGIKKVSYGLKKKFLIFSSPNMYA